MNSFHFGSSLIKMTRLVTSVDRSLDDSKVNKFVAC